MGRQSLSDCLPIFPDPHFGLYSIQTMPPRSRSFEVLSLLALLALCAAAAVVAVVALAFAQPGLLPAVLRPAGLDLPASALPVEALAATNAALAATDAAAEYPTFPPEWTRTPEPTATATAPPAPAATATPTRSPATAARTAAASPLPNLSATAAAGPDARVRADARGLRLRDVPGTAGNVVAFLEAEVVLDVAGRTADNAWLQVLTEAGQRGWVMTEFLDVYVDLAQVPLTAGGVLDASATPATTGNARVSSTGDNLRLRAGPGTAGTVIANLAAGSSLGVVGRTADNAWLEVNTEAAQHGWVMARYVDLFVSLTTVPVTGTAVDATPQPSATARPVALALPSATWPPTVAPALPTAAPLPAATLAAAGPLPAPATPPGSGAYVAGDYLTGLSPHAREIFLAGQALGNQANVFSKVGDSITVSPQFLSPIGFGQFDLRDYGHLAEAVSFFAAGRARTGNPFANTSLAARGGWSSFSVLSPSLADKTLCQVGESPLVCEYRHNRPALALIMLGTNDVPETSLEGYRENLRRIVADSVSRGIVPVLSTIPPFLRAAYAGRVEALNAVAVEVAQESGVPVWRYWEALQPLPNFGLGTDGVHPAWAPNATDFTPANLAYGSTVRNLTALLVLDAFLHQVVER